MFEFVRGYFFQSRNDVRAVARSSDGFDKRFAVALELFAPTVKVGFLHEVAFVEDVKNLFACNQSVEKRIVATVHGA